MRLTLLLLLTLSSLAAAAELDVWIGTTTPPGGPSQGVYHLTFDDQTGELSEAKLAAEAAQPGFLAKHPTLPVLYATIDDGDGAVAAFQIEGDALAPLGSVATGDGGPCHVALDETGRVLLSAQFGGGSVCSYRLNEDGSIAERVSHVEHCRPDPGDDDSTPPLKCHPHWVGVTAGNRFVVVPDLGRDRLFIHQLDPATAELESHLAVTVDPGAGPRHFAFHPTLPVAYVLNELALSVTMLDWKTVDDAFIAPARQRTVPTLSDRQKLGERFNSGSEIRVHPTGRFVYAANRGHDSITVFSAHPETGELSRIETEPIRGSWPRNFNLDPSGRWLLAAGRDSHTLAVFAIDQQTGELQYARETAYAPSPICVLFSEGR